MALAPSTSRDVNALRDESQREQLRAHFCGVNRLDGNATVERFYNFHSGECVHILAFLSPESRRHRLNERHI